MVPWITTWKNGHKKMHKTKEKKMIYENICFSRKQCIMYHIENALYSSKQKGKLNEYSCKVLFVL